VRPPPSLLISSRPRRNNVRSFPPYQSVSKLAKPGFNVLIEKGAGSMSHFSDADYEAAGARIVDAEEIWKNSDIVMKVRGRREGREEHTSSSNVMFIDYSTTGSRRVAVWCGGGGGMCRRRRSFARYPLRTLWRRVK
jgi:NAD/NADP transhydrogenase alpha subunit